MMRRALLRVRYDVRLSRLASQAAILIATASLATHSAVAQSTPPNRLQGPSVRLSEPLYERDELLRRELFRRRTAENAQKELEQLAEQLRVELAREVSARERAEKRAAELASRETLTNRLDDERQRLRDTNAESEKTRRAELEREIETLRTRLTKLREENATLRGNAANQNQPAGAKNDASQSEKLQQLTQRVQDLEAKLNAAEWARRLAEAQLDLVARGIASDGKSPSR